MGQASVPPGLGVSRGELNGPVEVIERLWKLAQLAEHEAAANSGPGVAWVEVDGLGAVDGCAFPCERLARPFRVCLFGRDV